MTTTEMSQLHTVTDSAKKESQAGHNRGRRGIGALFPEGTANNRDLSANHQPHELGVET